MSGNKSNILFYLIFLILLRVPLAQRLQLRDAELKGGLLFEKDLDKPIMINPKYEVYHRKIDLKEIFKAATVMEEFTNTYEKFCQDIEKVLKTDYTQVFVPNYDINAKFFISSAPTVISDAPQVCQREGYRLVEVRSVTDLTNLKRFADLHNVTYVYAGITFNNVTKTLQFDSDMETVNHIFSSVSYALNKGGKPTSSPPWDPITNHYWARSPNCLYDMARTVPDSLIMIQHNAKYYETKIICEKSSATPLDRQNNEFLLKITYHVCQRDYANMKNMASLLEREIELFRKINQPQSDASNITVENCPEFDCSNCKFLARIKHTLNKYAPQLERFIPLPADIIAKHIIFRATGAYKPSEFKRFLQYNFTRPYVSKSNDTFKNKSIKLWYTIACHFTEQTTYDESISAQMPLDKLTDYDYTHILKELNTFMIKLITPTRVKRYHDYEQITDAPFTALEPISFQNWEYWIFSSYHIKDFTNMHKAVKGNTRTIQDLNVNQKELKLAYRQLHTEITLMRNITRINEYAISTLFAEMDTKQACNKLYNIIQNSLLKLATSMSDALDNKISPFMLSPRELDLLATGARQKDVLLSSNMDDVESSLTRDDSNFFFTFSIPIIDNAALYRLYHVRNFPIFYQDNIGIMNIDSSYIGISVDTTQYIDLTEIEYHKCIDSSFCRYSGIPAPINAKSKCTVRTLRYNQQTCNITTSADTTPFFATYGNTTYYSVPANYAGNVICPNIKTIKHQNAVTGVLLISGVGSFMLQKTCFVQLPDDRKIINNNLPDATQDLGIPTLLEALHYAPKKDNFEFNLSKSQLWSNYSIPEVTLLDVELRSMKDLVTYTLKPQVVYPYLLITLLVFLCITIPLACLFCLSKRARAWFMAFANIRNPKKYWTQYKHYNVPGFEKIPQFNQYATEQLREKLSMNYLAKLFAKRSQSYDVTPAKPKPEYELQELVKARREVCETALRPTAPAVIMPNHAALYPHIINLNSNPTSYNNSYLPAEQIESQVVHKTVRFSDKVDVLEPQTQNNQ